MIFAYLLDDQNKEGREYVFPDGSLGLVYLKNMPDMLIITENKSVQMPFLVKINCPTFLNT